MTPSLWRPSHPFCISSPNRGAFLMFARNSFYFLIALLWEGKLPKVSGCFSHSDPSGMFSCKHGSSVGRLVGHFNLTTPPPYIVFYQVTLGGSWHGRGLWLLLLLSCLFKHTIYFIILKYKGNTCLRRMWKKSKEGKCSLQSPCLALSRSLLAAPLWGLGFVHVSCLYAHCSGLLHSRAGSSTCSCVSVLTCH